MKTRQNSKDSPARWLNAPDSGRNSRCGATSVEVVATIAIMVPFAGFVFFTGVKICRQVYETGANAFCWPFM
jgi:hypothetical protein